MFQNITCSNNLYMVKHLEINSQLDTITCTFCFQKKKQRQPRNICTVITIKPLCDIFEYVEHELHPIQPQ